MAISDKCVEIKRLLISGIDKRTLQIYARGTPTVYPLDYDKLERAAKRKLPKGNFNYVSG